MIIKQTCGKCGADVYLKDWVSFNIVRMWEKWCELHPSRCVAAVEAEDENEANIGFTVVPGDGTPVDAV